MFLAHLKIPRNFGSHEPQGQLYIVHPFFRTTITEATWPIVVKFHLGGGGGGGWRIGSITFWGKNVVAMATKVPFDF